MTVVVAAIGKVDEAVMAESRLCVRDRFGAGTAPLVLDEPVHAFDAGRGQYSSPAFMAAAAVLSRETGRRVLAVTERDLFIPMLTFVYGQAQLGGAVALVSTARLRQEFYGLAADARLLCERLRKEVAHELGHTLGLIHCPDKTCVMSLSTAILHVDRKSPDFCVSCRRVLDERLGRMESNEATLADSGR